MLNMDEDAMVASVDLVGRTGAKDIEIGFHEDDVPIGTRTDPPNWWAVATYKGAKISAEADDPIAAVESLARRLLIGAQCRRCGEPIRLSGEAPGCRWTRQGRKWEPGCGKPVDTSIPHL